MNEQLIITDTAPLAQRMESINRSKIHKNHSIQWNKLLYECGQNEKLSIVKYTTLLSSKQFSESAENANEICTTL